MNGLIMIDCFQWIGSFVCFLVGLTVRFLITLKNTTFDCLVERMVECCVVLRVPSHGVY